MGGILDIFYAVNSASHTGASDAGYAVEVVSPVETVCAWPGLRIVADRSYRAVRGPVDTLIVTGVDGPDDARRDPELVRWLARIAPRTRRVVGLCTRLVRPGRGGAAGGPQCDDALGLLRRAGAALSWRQGPAGSHLRSGRRCLHICRRHGGPGSRAGAGGGGPRPSRGPGSGPVDGHLPQAAGRPGAVQRPALHADGRSPAAPRHAGLGPRPSRRRPLRGSARAPGEHEPAQLLPRVRARGGHDAGVLRGARARGGGPAAPRGDIARRSRRRDHVRVREPGNDARGLSASAGREPEGLPEPLRTTAVS